MSIDISFIVAIFYDFQNNFNIFISNELIICENVVLTFTENFNVKNYNFKYIKM